MAHQENLEFFKETFMAFSEFIKSGKFLGIIDLGSLDINGGPHKFISKDTRYVGVDLGYGPNVDLVSPIELLDLPSLSFSIAISSEMLEHNPFWRESLYQMVRLTEPGGLVIWSCAGIGRPEHGTTKSDKGSAAPFVTAMGREHYKNISAREAQNSYNHELWFDHWSYFENFKSKDTYFIGLRRGSTVKRNKTFFDLNRKFEELYVTHFTPRAFFHLYKMPGMVQICLKAMGWQNRVLYYLYLIWNLKERNKFKRLKNALNSFLIGKK